MMTKENKLMGSKDLECLATAGMSPTNVIVKHTCVYLSACVVADCTPQERGHALRCRSCSCLHDTVQVL